MATRSQFCKLACLAFFIELALAGCQGDALPFKSPSGDSADTVSVDVPKSLAPGKLAMYAHGETIRVGDSAEDALKIFPRPKTAFEFTDLPPKFQKPYQVKGWESSREGFGVILFQQKIAVALWHQDKATQDDLDRLVKLHQDQSPGRAVTVPGKHVNYWFWENAGQRLMICSLQGHGPSVLLTVAMGDNVVMDALKINPVQAHRDRDEVDKSANAKPTLTPTK